VRTSVTACVSFFQLSYSNGMNFVVFDLIATDEFGVLSAAIFLQGLKYEHSTSILEVPVIFW